MGYGVCVHIVYEHRALSCTGFRRQTEAKPYGDYAEIVGKSCCHRAVSAASARKSYRARATSVRRSRRDDTVTVRFPYDLCSLCSFWHSCTKTVQIHISACVVGWDDT